MDLTQPCHYQLCILTQGFNFFILKSNVLEFCIWEDRVDIASLLVLLNTTQKPWTLYISNIGRYWKLERRRQINRRQKRQRSEFFNVFFSLIYPRLGIEEANDVGMPVEERKKPKQRPVLSSQRTRKRQLSKTENFQIIKDSTTKRTVVPTPPILAKAEQSEELRLPFTYNHNKVPNIPLG